MIYFKISSDEAQIWTWALITTDGEHPTVITGGTAPLQSYCLDQVRAFKASVAEAAVPERLDRDWT